MLDATKKTTLLFLDCSPPIRTLEYIDWNKVEDDAHSNPLLLTRYCAKFLLDAFPSHVKCVFGIQNTPFISVFYLLSDVRAFEHVNGAFLYACYPITSDRNCFIRDCVHKMEKQFASSEFCSMNFWWSLVDPETPDVCNEWFVNIVRELSYMNDPLHPAIKTLLIKLRTLNPNLYTKIMTAYKSVIKTTSSVEMMIALLKDLYIATVLGLDTHAYRILVSSHPCSSFLLNLLENCTIEVG